MLITPLLVQNNRFQSLDNDGEDVIQGLTQAQKNLPPKYFYRSEERRVGKEC